METVKGVSLKHQIEDGGNIRVKISGRLSFAHLFKPDDFNGSSKPKYKATFIIEDDAMTADIKTLINHVASSCAELKGKKLGADKLCLRDGNEVSYGGYEGNWYLTAAADRAPQVLDQHGAQINDENKIYSGCYVNGVVRIWPQANSYGTRVNATLEIVQFAHDGERFGGGSRANASDWLDTDEADGTVDMDVI